MRTKKHGVDTVCKAGQMPARQIAVNAGADGSVVVGKTLDTDQYSIGYETRSGAYGNIVGSCTIGPTKVARFASQDAAPWL